MRVWPRSVTANLEYRRIPWDAAPGRDRDSTAPEHSRYRRGFDNARPERSGPPQYQRRNSTRSPSVHVADAAR